MLENEMMAKKNILLKMMKKKQLRSNSLCDNPVDDRKYRKVYET